MLPMGMLFLSFRAPLSPLASSRLICLFHGPVINYSCRLGLIVLLSACQFFTTLVIGLFFFLPGFSQMTLNNLLGNSTKKEVHYEHTERKGASKYLRKSGCHHIECPAANFVATFMWRRPLNSATLVTKTLKRPESVFDGINDQV